MDFNLWQFIITNLTQGVNYKAYMKYYKYKLINSHKILDMKNFNYYLKWITIIVLIVTFSITIHGQNLPRVNRPFPDFTLESHKGETVSLSQLKGKNVLLIFPRGKVSDHWCQLCHYQYAELAKLEFEQGIRDKYNLEIIFILPYPMDEVILWTEMFPSQMADIQRWKNTPVEQLNPGALQFINAIKDVLPINFEFNEENPATLPFPVLADKDHSFSTKLKLFSTAWDGFYNEQNEPIIFILDKEGVIRFKYKSQETFDRLPTSYIVEVLDKML